MSRPARQPGGDSGDAGLVRRIHAGDRGAVDALYDRLRRPAFALARRILADDALAEAVLQDVFLGVWRDPGAFDRARGSVAARLMAAVHHRAVDAVRREQSQRRRRARTQGPGAAGSWVVSDRVGAALRQLPEAQREALTLAYYGGYTQREVAALTGAPLGTVKTRMLAGMRRLREQLRDAGDGVRLDGSGR